MKKSALILSIFMICATLGMSQSYTFKVLASKGVTQVDNGSGWTALKTGTKLTKNSKVKVSNGSYVGLMHSSGKTMELKSEGTYSVSNLSGKLNNSKSSFTSKYASFVMNKMNAGEGGQSYSTTGSVSRGKEIEVLAPEKDSKLLKSVPFKFAWNGEDDKGYKVSVLTLFNEELWTETVKSNSVNLDFSGLKLEEGKHYLISVVPLSKPDDFKNTPFSLVDASKESAVREELTGISGEISEDSPMDQLTMASFYAEQGLRIYVLSSLSKACELAPEVEDFKTLRLQYFHTEAKK